MAKKPFERNIQSDKALVQKVLKDPELFPDEFKSWLRSYLNSHADIIWEQSQIPSIPASKISKDAFTAYVPSWTSSGTAPAIGNGTLTGRYIQIGKLVVVVNKVTMGSTTTFGTGAYFMSLPVPMTAAGSFIGTTRSWDNSAAASYHGFCARQTSTTIYGATLAVPSTFWGSTTPFTFAVSDYHESQLIYEAA